MKYTTFIVALMILASVARAGETPDSVVQHFIDHAVAGRTNDAASCYAMSNEAQRTHVEMRLAKYMPAAMSGQELLQPLRSFVDGTCAVTAVLVKSSESPGVIQIERCYMIQTADGWKLLPMSDDFRSRTNGLSPEQLVIFEKLKVVVDAYQREEVTRLMKKESEPEH